MKRIILFFLPFAVLFFQGCGSSTPTDKKSSDSLNQSAKINGNSRDLMLNKIKRLDSLAHLPGVIVPDKNLAQQLISAYGEFTGKYPEDTLSQKFSFLAVSVAVNTYSDQQALVLIDNCLKSFPNHPRKIELLLMKALVYDDRFGDKPNAKKVYEQIITEFPNTPAAEQAKDAIKLTGKSDLELIRELERKNGIKK